MGVQSTANARQRRRQGKGQGLVASQVDAHALRRNLRIANRHKGTPRRGTQQVHDGQCGPHGDQQAQEIKLFCAVQRPAADGGITHRQTGVAARHPLPAGHAFFNNEAERQRGHAQVNAFDAQRRQTHDDAHDGREQTRANQRQRKRHPGIDHDRLGVSPDTQERRVAQREQPGKACQQHQAHAHHRVDQHKGQLRQPVLGHHPRGGHQEQAQQAVPKYMAAVLGQLHVLVVIGFKNETHARASNFLAQLFAEQAIGLEHQHQ